MDAITDPAVTQVSVMKSARVGYTKILDHVVGYYRRMTRRRSSLFNRVLKMPKITVKPRSRRCCVIPRCWRKSVVIQRPRTVIRPSSKDLCQRRQFDAGGANSPGGFRRITCRIILFDEVDGYPSGGAGVEGDQIALGIKRSETFWNRKIARFDANGERHQPD